MSVYLEYPRCLHKPGGQTCLVTNDAEKAEKLEAGWSLLPVTEDAPTPEPVTEPEPSAEPPKAKGKKRADTVN